MHRNKLRRFESALELRKIRATRSPEQQLAFLDAKLGSGVGAAKERARLHHVIATKHETPTSPKKEKRRDES